jgi:hypothetical protein
LRDVDDLQRRTRRRPCRHHKCSGVSTAGRNLARPRYNETRVGGLYGGRVRPLGWLTRERTAGDRAAPSVLDWLVALALVAVGLLEIADGMFPGPLGLVVAVLIAGLCPSPSGAWHRCERLAIPVRGSQLSVKQRVSWCVGEGDGSPYCCLHCCPDGQGHRGSERPGERRSTATAARATSGPETGATSHVVGREELDRHLTGEREDHVRPHSDGRSSVRLKG